MVVYSAPVDRRMVMRAVHHPMESNKLKTKTKKGEINYFGKLYYKTLFVRTYSRIRGNICKSIFRRTMDLSFTVLAHNRKN